MFLSIIIGLVYYMNMISTMNLQSCGVSNRVLLICVFPTKMHTVHLVGV